MKPRKLWKSAVCFFVMVPVMWGTTAFAVDRYVNQGTGVYRTVQDAIAAANPGDVVLVADGVYTGEGNVNLLIDKAITIKSENGSEKCTIDCRGTSRAFTFSGAATSGAVLSGFTITGGKAASGGAILCQNGASPNISDCILSTNEATSYGGAIACLQSSPIISRCVMKNNNAPLGGGLFVYNTVASDPSPTLIACTIANNSANKGGGVYLVRYASPSFYNCLIADNSASQEGGAFYCYNRCAPNITHCTVSGNTSTSFGSGMYCYFCLDPDFPAITNSIIWGNSTEGGSEFYLFNSRLDISFSAFNQGTESRSNISALGSSAIQEDGNIHEDPAFVEPGNYHLSPDSPCIDAGVPLDNIAEFDIDGDTRVLGEGPDMGADEFKEEEEIIHVDIDIKPGCSENKINLNSWVLLPVAVKTTKDFDARSIDPGTVEFAGARPVWRICYDVDRDRDKDMLFFFKIKQLNLPENSTEATLTGMTRVGVAFEGTDKVNIIKPKGKARFWHFGRR